MPVLLNLELKNRVHLYIIATDSQYCFHDRSKNSKRKYSILLHQSIYVKPLHLRVRVPYNISVCFMRSSARSFAKKITPCPQRSMAYVSGCRLKGKAAKDHANDGTGNHPHRAENYCIKERCEKLKCPSLCDTPKSFRIVGHGTHKPPIGRFSQRISDTDANGDPNPQYYVKSNKKNEMTEQEKQNYGNQIKPDAKMEAHMDKHKDKYD